MYVFVLFRQLSSKSFDVPARTIVPARRRGSLTGGAMTLALSLGCGASLWGQLPHPPPPVLPVPAHSITQIPDSQVSSQLSTGAVLPSKATAHALRQAEKYRKGKGVPVDLVQAAYWYRIAADQGEPRAQNMLGYFYLRGIGVAKNEGEALRWFLRGSSGGSRGAKLNLAVMYMRGIGVRQDPEMACDLLRQLADAGIARGQAYLGIVYYDGLGVAPDHAAAEKWFSKAAKAKDPEALYAMGRFYWLEPNHEHNYRKAARFFRRSAESGFLPAMQELAVLLLGHPEIPRGAPEEPITLLRRSAEAGLWRSSDVLGIVARDGVGRRSDQGEAFRWFKIAARQGGREAESKVEKQLTTCCGELSQDEQDKQSGIAELWFRQHPSMGLFSANIADSTQAVMGEPGMGQAGSSTADTE